MDPTDEALVARALDGERSALEDLIARHQDFVLNLARRMVWEPQDAEDIVQEVFLKLITRLASFEGRSSFRTWLYRITANHILNRSRTRMEEEPLGFSTFGEQLDAAPDLDLPDPSSLPVDLKLLVDEARIGCTMGMLMCLDRRQRMAYVLTEVFGLDSKLAASTMELQPDAYRQLLHRARRDLQAFMNENCGLVREENPCRCHKKTRAFMQAGYVDPHNLRFATAYRERVADLAESRDAELGALSETIHRRIYRDHPYWNADQQKTLLTTLLESPAARELLDW